MSELDSNDSPSVATQPASSSNRTNRYVLFFTLAAAGCAIDLATKSYMFDWLGGPGEGGVHWLIEGIFGFETALNRGALFGMGQGMVWLFALMSFLALGGIGWWLVRFRAIDDWLLTFTLGLVCGGVLGNLYDRLGIWSGYEVYAVRDWIRVSYQGHVWPNFNIADSLLVCGAALLIWHSFRYTEPATS